MFKELDELRDKAKAAGAMPQLVTREGYTQLPPEMANDVASGGEGHIWFLKQKGRWEAWPEAELDRMLVTIFEALDHE